MKIIAEINTNLLHQSNNIAKFLQELETSIRATPIEEKASADKVLEDITAAKNQLEKLCEVTEPREYDPSDKNADSDLTRRISKTYAEFNGLISAYNQTREAINLDGHKAGLLIEAVKNDDSKLHKLIVDIGVDQRIADRYGCTALHYAAAYGRQNRTKKLLEQPHAAEALRQANGENETPLDVAIRTKQLIVSKLIGEADKEGITQINKNGVDRLEEALSINAQKTFRNLAEIVGPEHMLHIYPITGYTLAHRAVAMTETETRHQIARHCIELNPAVIYTPDSRGATILEIADNSKSQGKNTSEFLNIADEVVKNSTTPLHLEYLQQVEPKLKDAEIRAKVSEKIAELLVPTAVPQPDAAPQFPPSKAQQPS